MASQEAEGGGAAEAAEGLLREAEAKVRELEELEDYYFRPDKEEKLRAAAAAATDLSSRVLSTPGVSTRQLQPQVLFLKGRAASFLRGQEQAAEALLSKAIKLNPKCLGAWNALGEVYWNLRAYARSHDCFRRAIELCGKNALSLRSLSMVLRALDTSEGASASQAKQGHYAEALELAKEAVTLDAKDPQNWETLGNGYMGDFFVNMRPPSHIDRALVAYSKAEDGYSKLGRGCPTLHLNRGMAAKYVEDYSLALRSFRKAHAIGAASAAGEEQKLLDLIERLSGSVGRKNDLKVKHLRELTANFEAGSESRSLKELMAGEGQDSAPLVARVVKFINRNEELPVIIVCCDARGEFFALSIYSAQPAKVAEEIITMKSLLRVQQPKVRQISVPGPSGKGWTYASVRVSNPGDVTVVGSGSLAHAAAQSVFSAGAERVEVEAGTPKELERPVRGGGTDSPTDQERWIEAEDARTKKQAEEARAKAQAKARAARAKAKAKERRAKEKTPQPAAGRPAVAAEEAKGAENEEEEEEDEEDDLEEDEGEEPVEAAEEEAEVQLGEDRGAAEAACLAGAPPSPGAEPEAQAHGGGGEAAAAPEGRGAPDPAARPAGAAAGEAADRKAPEDAARQGCAAAAAAQQPRPAAGGCQQTEPQRTAGMLLDNGLTVRHTFIDVGPHGAGAHKRSASWPRSTVDVAAEEEDPPTSAAVSPAAAEQPPPKPRWADLESEAESVRSTGGRPSTPHMPPSPQGRQDTPTALERTRSAPAWPTTATGARRYVPPPARAYAQGGWAGGAASSMAAAAATAAPWHAPAGAVAAIAGGAEPAAGAPRRPSGGGAFAPAGRAPPARPAAAAPAQRVGWR